MAAKKHRAKSDEPEDTGGPRPQPDCVNPEHIADNGTLTHEGMLHVIRSGGSVMHHGRVIAREEDLPEEAELVAGDEERSRQLLDSYDDRIAETQRERARVAAQLKAKGAAEHKARTRKAKDEDKADTTESPEPVVAHTPTE